MTTFEATRTAPFCDLGRAVIQAEADAVLALKQRLNHDFSKACQLILDCKGRIVVTGMGKSGHIANKIASTLASTGTPAFFVHPGEANHGDMGMITHQDVVIALSNSGESFELITILPLLKRLKTPLIALTGRPSSTLATHANVHLDVSVSKEACPLGLAPTSSTTAALVMGDAIAIALLEARGFTSDDFALFHPGGALGRRLLLRVSDIMHMGEAIPKVQPTCLLTHALMEITQKRLGMTTVVDDHNVLLGIFTDGDLRRALDKNIDIRQATIQEVMTTNCKTIPPSLLAAEALQIMQEKKITSLIVINESQHVIGIVHLHEILRAGVT